jgi:NAD(P)-dependent dehydrogenase (short-subunit alcohol dehydrogenase family)
MEKVALVTGGTYGIGRAITLALARENFAVVRSATRPRKDMRPPVWPGKKGWSRRFSRGMFPQSSDVARIVAAAAQRYGRIDVLCNNAAIRSEGNLLETEEQTWDRIMAVNLRGVYLVTRAVLPHMIRQQGGVIITTGSTSGHGAKNLIAYATAKGALAAFTMSWRSTMPKITFAPCSWFRDSL